MAALAFGPIHNITTKSLGVVSPGEIEPGMLTKIFLKLKKLLRLDKKKSTETEENKEEEGRRIRKSGAKKIRSRRQSALPFPPV